LVPGKLTPIDQVLIERNHTTLVKQMQLAGLIKIQNRREVLGRPVKEQLIVLQVNAIAECAQLLYGLGKPDTVQATRGDLLQLGPAHLVPYTAHIQNDRLHIVAIERWTVQRIL